MLRGSGGGKEEEVNRQEFWVTQHEHMHVHDLTWKLILARLIAANEIRTTYVHFEMYAVLPFSDDLISGIGAP